MRVGIDVESAAVITRAFLSAPEVVMEELEVAMESATEYLLRETVERTPAGASNTLRGAFVGEVGRAGDVVSGVVRNPLSYALPVELGTRPHFPPVDAIQNWVEVKLGITDDAEAAAAALAIARKIAARGTVAVGMAHRALRDGRETVQAEFAEAAARITARIGGQA